MDTAHYTKSCNNTAIINGIDQSRAKTDEINAATTSNPEQATQLSECDTNNIHEAQPIASHPRKRMVKNMINTSNMTLKESAKGCSIANGLTKTAMTDKSIATTNTTSGHSTQFSDWGSSSESSMDEGTVASIVLISKKEIIQSYKCQRRMKLKESAQSSTNEEKTNCVSERTKMFVQNYAATQSKLSQSNHVLELESSSIEEDMIGARICPAPMRTPIQKKRNHGNRKTKEAGNIHKDTDRNGLVKHSAPTKKTVTHQNITKPTDRINNSSEITTPDGQTKYGPDGLTPNGMNHKEIEKMDQPFCVEKPGGVHDREYGKLDARQSNYGTIVKQKRAMNSQGMAFGWKKTRYGIKKNPQ